MLIPKITYLDNTTGTINGQDIMTISLRESSQTNSVVTSFNWTANVISGPGTASLSNPTDKDVSLIIDNTQDITVEVVLTVTDQNGFTAQTKVGITKSGGDVWFTSVNVNAFVLPGALTEFTVTDAPAIIAGTPIVTVPAYATYNFDKENDTVIDDTSTAPTTFSNIYTSAATASLNALGGIAPFEIFTQVAFNPIIENPEDLNISITDDCKSITVYSETEDYLSKLIGRGNLDNSAMTKLDVTLTKNCCTSEAITVSLCPTYDLGITQPASYTPTGQYFPDYYGNDPTRSFELYTAEMTITGIDAAVISSITYTNRGDGTSTTVTSFTEPPQITVDVMIESEEPNPPGYALLDSQVDQTNTIEITTVTGCVYTITYTLSLNGPLVTVMDLTIDSIDYPELPCGVTINEEPFNTTLTIDSNFGGDNCDAELETFADGIVQVTLNDSGISNESVTACLFVDCETYCLVVEALSNGCNPIIGVLYDALTYSANCPDITCQNLCDLYEIFAAYMDQCNCTVYQNNIVSSGNDCGCNS